MPVMVLSDRTSDCAKVTVTVWAFIECILFSGIAYGWSSLVFIFKQEGIYSYVCEIYSTPNASATNDMRRINLNDRISTITTSTISTTRVLDGLNRNLHVYNEEQTATCVEQDSKMLLCFTVATLVGTLGNLVIGQLNFKYGTRISRLTICACYTAGILCLAFVSTDYPWLMFPGLTMVYAGGIPILVTNVQVSNLFVGGRLAIVGLLSGALDTSAAVFVLIKLAFEAGFSRRDSFLVLCALYVTMFMISTMLLMPRTFIQIPAQTSNAILDRHGEVATCEGTDTPLEQCVKMNEVHNSTTVDAEDPPELSDGKINSVKRCLMDLMFYGHLLWTCLLGLRFFFFIGNMNSYLNRVLRNDNAQVSHFTNVAFFIFMGGIVMSLVCGALNDWLTRICSIRGKSSLYKDLMPAALPLSITSVISVISSVLVLINDTRLLYAIFVCILIQRSFLFSMVLVFLKAVYTTQLLLLLYGMSMFSLGVFGCAQYGLFSWSAAYDTAYQHVEICLLCGGLLSLLHPGYIIWRCLREEKK